MRPVRPSGFPVLIGRPWLYGVDVTTDWAKKEFRFGRPEVKVSWGDPAYEGETPQEEDLYNSEITPEEEEDYEDAMYLMQYLNALTEEEVFSDKYKKKEVAVNMVTLVEEEPSDNLTSPLSEEEEASEGVIGDIAEQFMAAEMGIPSPCTTGEQEAKRGAELSPPKKSVS
ncbi:unnamed protein product [Calypogeia fissa]